MPLPNDDFWENEHRTLLAILRPRMAQMAYSGAQDAGRKAGIGFDAMLYNQYAENWARIATDRVLVELGTTSQKVVGNILADWINRPGATVGELNAELTPYFGPTRANTIAVTEATRAFASGEEFVYLNEGITEWTWQTNRDELVCRYCGPLHNKTVKIGQPFAFDRKGKPITKPPFHPRCRCWVKPKISKDRQQAPKKIESQNRAQNATAVKTLAAAADYARKTLGLKFSDYKGADIRVANEWNRALTDAFERMPELKEQTKAAGTTQGMYTNQIEYYVQRYLADNQELMTKSGFSKEAQLYAAQRYARRMVRKTPKNTYAFSYSYTPNDTDGIFINGKWKHDTFISSLKNDVDSGWHPVGTDSIKAVVDHELGHQIETLLKLDRNTEITELFSSYSKEDINIGLSKYAATKKTEFIAEAWSEYVNNPTPRLMAQKVGDLILKLYNEKYGK